LGFLHRHDQPAGVRYQMREKLFAIGDDFWIETPEGDRAFKVDGKALRVRDTFVLESAAGEKLYEAQRKALRVRETMEIERDGHTVATIKKALVTPLRERFTVHLESDDELHAKGNILDHEYKIERDGDTVAEVSKRWFRIRDTYGIEIVADADHALMVAVTACIDEMEHA
jgi:uncharacterized protein YxjI